MDGRAIETDTLLAWIKQNKDIIKILLNNEDII